MKQKEEIIDTNFWHQKHHQREASILKVTKKLIIQYGVTSVSMGQIAKASNLSRQRLYMYFPNLQSIVYRIQIEDMSNFLSFLAVAFKDDGEGAIERIKRGIPATFAYAKKHMDDFIFTSAFDSCYNAIGVPAVLGKTYDKLVNGGGIKNAVAEVFVSGVASGEFRSDMDIVEVGTYWVNVFQSVLSRYAFFLNKGTKGDTETAVILEKRFIESLLSNITK